MFGTVALLSGAGISYVLERRSATRRRLAMMASGQGATGVLGDASLLSMDADPALKKLKTYVPKSPKEMNALQRKLASAGYHGVRPIVIYCAAEALLAV